MTKHSFNWSLNFNFLFINICFVRFFFNDMLNISYCTVSFRQYLIKLHCTHTFQGSTIEIGEREIKRIYLYWYIIIIFHSENRTKTNFFLYSKVTQNTSHFFQCYYPGMLPWKIFVDIIFFCSRVLEPYKQERHLKENE